MTIVLQHQYWDLVLDDEHFEVTVSFNKQHERIRVPFTALSAFVDPSVRFGLQFDRKDKGTVPGPAVVPQRADAASPAALPAPDKRPAGAASPTPEGAPAEPAGEAATAADEAGKVVKLDLFRKK